MAIFLQRKPKLNIFSPLFCISTGHFKTIYRGIRIQWISVQVFGPFVRVKCSYSCDWRSLRNVCFTVCQREIKQWNQHIPFGLAPCFKRVKYNLPVRSLKKSWNGCDVFGFFICKSTLTDNTAVPYVSVHSAATVQSVFWIFINIYNWFTKQSYTVVDCVLWTQILTFRCNCSSKQAIVHVVFYYLVWPLNWTKLCLNHQKKTLDTVKA